jgi:EAL and modified HD-GYP domain-containing signal transduction protein
MTTITTTQQYYLARQPILDAKQSLFAYELLFRDSETNHAGNLPSNAEATARVLSHTINQSSLNNVIGNHLAFINIDESILELDVLDILDPKCFILEVLENAEISENLIGKLTGLFDLGFRIALDDFGCTPAEFERAKPLWPLVSLVKIDLMACSLNDVKPHLTFFRQRNIDLLAEKVEELEQFEECSKLGFRYFQGYFFARPKIITGKKLDASQQGILEVIQLLQQEADVAKLEFAFKKHSSLTVFLLKFINSAAYARPNRIETIRQAIGMVGREKLRQWLMLLLCAGKTDDIENNPMAHMTLMRAKLIEHLLVHLSKNDRLTSEKGFLTGILSKLNVSLGLDLQEIFSSIFVSEDIQNAVIEHQGVLGDLLKICELQEVENWQEMHEMKILLTKINLSAEDLSKMLVKCISEVNQSFS